MANHNLQKLFKELDEGNFFKSLVFVGENAFVFSELRELAVKNSFVLKRFLVNKQGPGAEVEAEAMGMGLFGGGSLVWLKSSHGPDQWSSEGQRLYGKILELCDGQTLALILELPEQKKSSKNTTLLDGMSLSMDNDDLLFWTERINQKLINPLSQDKIQFLIQYEADLLQYSQWMELWSMGGDLWAKASLGWQGESIHGLEKKNFRQAPVFAFVDALLSNQKEAVNLLEYLFATDQDPLALLGLLSRNARLLGEVQRGERPEKLPPFVIQKLKKSSLKATSFLKECSELDVLMKSTATDSKALCLRMIDRIF